MVHLPTESMLVQTSQTLGQTPWFEPGSPFAMTSCESTDHAGCDRFRCARLHNRGEPALAAISALERDDFSSNRHLALTFCLSMIFSENRYTLFRIML